MQAACGCGEGREWYQDFVWRLLGPGMLAIAGQKQLVVSRSLVPKKVKARSRKLWVLTPLKSLKSTQVEVPSVFAWHGEI